MLAGSMLLADSWKEGTFVALYPCGERRRARLVKPVPCPLTDPAHIDISTPHVVYG